MKRSPWSRDKDEPPIALPDRETRINITDLIERIMRSNEFTRIEREFLLDCIAECTKPSGAAAKWPGKTQS